MYDRSNRSLCLVSVVAFLFVAEAALSQVAARQGDPKEERPNDFTSPMILELPLPDLSALDEKHVERYRDEIRDYFCDDVSIRELRLQRRRAKGEGPDKRVFFRVRGDLFVRPSRDRRVSLKLGVVRGDATLAELEIENLDAEEKKRTGFKGSFWLREAELEEAFASAPAPVLRVSLWVRED